MTITVVFDDDHELAQHQIEVSDRLRARTGHPDGSLPACVTFIQAPLLGWELISAGITYGTDMVQAEPIAAAALAGARLDLEPLRVEHADELAPVLDDPALHAFTGGQPATLTELRGRYARQVVGRSADGTQRWLNWVVRRRADGQPIGFVQATVSDQDQQRPAEVAWVIGTAFQGQRYAREAAGLMVDWLRASGVGAVVAFIHPDHQASGAVARSLGLGPTTDLVDGEVRWTDLALRQAQPGSTA